MLNIGVWIMVTTIMLGLGAVALAPQAQYQASTVTQAEKDTAELLQAIQEEQRLESLVASKMLEVKERASEHSLLIEQLQQATAHKFDLLIALGMD